MVTKLHILLSYKCTLKCKHCYVYSDQKAPGKISLSQVSRFLNDGRKVAGLEWVYFGGGEPFTQYPLLLKAIQRARKLDYRVGVETNGYFARTEEAALRLLRPLASLGVEDLRVSNDAIHYRNPSTSPANKALNAAHRLGIPTTLVQMSPPGENGLNPASTRYADRVDQPRFMYTGRAAEMFTKSAEGNNWSTFNSCPRSDLADPDCVYVDAYGFVQLCPGIAIGNACLTSLHKILQNYDPRSHEILSILGEKGPAGLIEASGSPGRGKFVDACHACYSSRKQLLDAYPELLGPLHVYGF